MHAVGIAGDCRPAERGQIFSLLLASSSGSARLSRRRLEPRRNLVTERVSLGGIPVELVDTAGMRQASDEAEQIGIRKSREALAHADMVLMVLGATAAPGQQELKLLATLAQRRALVVVNKSDRPTLQTQWRRHWAAWACGGSHLGARRTRSGRATEKCWPWWAGAGGDGGRYVDQLSPIPGSHRNPGWPGSRGRRSRAKYSARDGTAGFVAALRHLDSLTGETTTDDILNLIFSTFCIGKSKKMFFVPPARLHILKCRKMDHPWLDTGKPNALSFRRKARLSRVSK